MSLREWAEAFLKSRKSKVESRKAAKSLEAPDGSPEDKAIALLSLTDAFTLLDRVTQREYFAWQNNLGKSEDELTEHERVRSGYLLAKYLETFARLVGLTRAGYFDAREYGAEQQPVRVPDFEGVEDEAKRKELLDRYKKVLEEEERLIQETAGLAD